MELLTWGAEVVIDPGNLFFGSGGAPMPIPQSNCPDVSLDQLPGCGGLVVGMHSSWLADPSASGWVAASKANHRPTALASHLVPAINHPACCFEIAKHIKLG